MAVADAAQCVEAAIPTVPSRVGRVVNDGGRLKRITGIVAQAGTSDCRRSKYENNIDQYAIDTERCG